MSKRWMPLLLAVLMLCGGLLWPAAAEPVTESEEDAGQELSSKEAEVEAEAVSAIADDATLDMEAKLSAIFRRYQTLGACVCVVENGQITYTACYGERDPGGEKITEDTLFRVGSISKMITAMGVMKLVESGRLALDGDLSDMLPATVRHPQYPNTPVTLRQLMSHTAGLRDSGYYTLALKGNAAPLSRLFSGERLQYVFFQDFEAGTDVSYSNFGGGLLGCIIEQATGQTVDAYMNEAIFEPLGITAAYQAALLPADAPVANMYAMPSRALGASLRDGSPARTEADPEHAYTLTAGKLTLSAPDLAKLLIALCDGGVCGDVRVLAESSAAAMRTRQNYLGTVACESGRGLCMNILDHDTVEGRILYGHGGKANGMLCAAYFDPTDRTGVVMLTNGCNNRPMDQNVGMLSRAVMRLCYAQLIDGRHVTEDPFLVEE